jgi:hypothetical protein
LVSLLAYRDDAHVAAWRSEGYSAPATRLATYLFRRTEPVPSDKLMQWPLFYDERYLNAGLDELLKEADVEQTDSGYILSKKGAARREKVETLTDDCFRAPFEQRISENGRRVWMTLMMLLAEGGKSTTPSSMFNSTVSLPVPTLDQMQATSVLSEPKSKA